MRYLSVCSGIEAASVAWHPLGFQPVGFSEIARFPCEVLAARYGSNLPGKPLSHNAPPNFGDMSKFKEWPDAAFDVLVGGTPCQSFSIAGFRKGLADPRGNLCLTYLAIADRYRPELVVWENVPGVLSSGGGRDFAAFIGGLEQLGYHAAWRVLDAQYVRVDGFGRAVPQRRRRVFVVGHLGDWRRAAAILFEPESMSRDSAPRRKAGKGFSADVVSNLVSSGRGVERAGETRGQDPVVAVRPDISHCLNAGGMGRQDYETETMIAHTLLARRDTPIIAFPGRMSSTKYASAENCSPSLGALNPTALAFDMRGRDGGAQFEGLHETANMRAASGGSSRSYVAEQWAVRRLTPLECERLQGFPDGYTAIQIRGKPAADVPRYKALGNSMAVNVMRWIGRRIEMVDSISKQLNN